MHCLVMSWKGLEHIWTLDLRGTCNQFPTGTEVRIHSVYRIFLTPDPLRASRFCIYINLCLHCVEAPLGVSLASRPALLTDALHGL